MQSQVSNDSGEILRKGWGEYEKKYEKKKEEKKEKKEREEGRGNRVARVA